MMDTMKREWVASIPWGRISMLGGTLALTDEAVTFTPLGALGRERRFPLNDVEGVSPVADRPPRLRVTTAGGKSLVLMVLPSRGTPVWTRDTSARDQAVEVISGRLAHR
jgi:hypothetical protein